MANISDLDCYILYTITNSDTGQLIHVGKVSSQKSLQNIKDKLEENETFKELGTFTSIKEITAEIRYYKLRNKHKESSYKKPRKSRIKYTNKKSDTKANYFIEYKLVNGTYELVPIMVTDYS